MKNSKNLRRLKRHRQVIWSEMIPRSIYKTLKGAKKMEPTPNNMTAVLSINVVDFTYVCIDGTPEQVTSILNKLFDMVEHKLENYENLFKVRKVYIKILHLQHIVYIIIKYSYQMN